MIRARAGEVVRVAPITFKSFDSGLPVWCDSTPTITITDPADSIIYTAQNVTLTLTDNTITNNATNANDSYFVHLSNASSILTATGNSFNTPNLSDGPYVYLAENDLAALVSDENCFGHASQWFRKGAGNYGTVAQYQSATSQDGNSTVGDC